MGFNAFVGGVQPGGLTSDFEVKLLICFLLDSIQQPLTFDQLNDILQNTGFVNYFEFTESMSELEKSGHISFTTSEEGEKQYSVSKVGSVAAQTFSKSLPLTVRDKTLESAQKMIAADQCMDKVEIDYQEADDGYILHLVMKDIGSDLLDLKMFLPSEEECVLLREKIRQDPAGFYEKFLFVMMS